ncbi:MAG: 50S ribosomal protein L24 [Schleiferiaceae bacterium]|jgi:large subunit ribosomal protein L24|nr:50S ribosomal protein L24 [Schleiferiaceae bacterium]MDP4628013.1 50S ribosomal protein L24 [Schleiferiaceae bacterium]MDP4728461.1 50S ribosomal protein L24 [Schleiferiaceae bacterium]MDP4750053.1 50S ribosomal protein L24 [Schleiferiaceae bacterium]MDP4859481.1 50S ribosomal protein L24 [Schleiferiaceae bacterium]
MAKFHIKTGDTVMVIAGQSKGQTGRIIRMIPKQHRAVVEGVNMVTKHQKPTASSPQGGLSQMEAPLHVSNLMLIDPKTGTPTRVGMKINDKGQKVRVAKKSGETIK